MEWFSYVIAVCVGLSAVISPVATAIINNKHQLKLKELELFEQSKRVSLINFIEAVENCRGDYTYNKLNRYYTCLNNLYLYFELYDNSVQVLTDVIISKDTNNFQSTLNQFVRKLSKQLKKQL